MNEQLLGIRLTSIKHSAFICKTAAPCSLKDLHFNGSHISYGFVVNMPVDSLSVSVDIQGYSTQVDFSGPHLFIAYMHQS